MIISSREIAIQLNKRVDNSSASKVIIYISVRNIEQLSMEIPKKGAQIKSRIGTREYGKRRLRHCRP